MSSPVPTQSSNPGQSTSAPYAKRVISVNFSLSAGSFQGGGNSLSVSGLRTLAHITYANTPTPGQLLLKIQGLTLDQINTLSRAGTTYTAPVTGSGNTVTVAAGDLGGALTTVFMGNVMYAYPAFNNQPDVAFIVQANGTYDLQLKSVTPVSFPGAVPVQQALTQILQPVGVTVQNNGVNATLQSPYFPGTVWAQANRAIKAAGAAGFFNPITKTLTIWPINNPTPPGTPIMISPQTGMIGYPEFQQNNIVVRTLFSGNVFTTPSQQIQVQSQLASANGIWTAFGVEYTLSSEDPGGPWETVITASPQKITTS